MSEENPLILIPEIESNLSQNDATFNEMATATRFLARIQLMGGNSALVVEGKIPKAGVWAYIVHGREIPEILGDSFDCAVLAWRPKAMHLLDNAPEGIYYETTLDLFKECVNRSGENPETNGGHSFMYGPEFLLWTPRANNGEGGFGGLFCSSKTARNSAPALRDLVKRQATVKARFIAPKKSRFKWWGPVFEPCTTPLDNMPTPEILREELTKFLNPPQEEKVLAPESATDREM